MGLNHQESGFRSPSVVEVLLGEFSLELNEGWYRDDAWGGGEQNDIQNTQFSDV